MDRKEQLRQLLRSTTALLEAMRYSASTASGDAANIGKYSGYGIFLRKYNSLLNQARPLLTDTIMLDGFDLSRVRGIGDTSWPEQKVYFEMAYQMPPF